MTSLVFKRIRRILANAALTALVAVLSTGHQDSQAQDAASLKARHTALREQLASNQFQRPLYLESTNNSGDLKGDVYAVVNQPFSTVGPALQGVDHWCDILMLHLNVKYCGASPDSPANGLRLAVGRKYDQPMEDAHQIDFNYTTDAANTNYLRVHLNADAGPMGTKNYRLSLEAVPLDDKRSFVHMSYAYGFGFSARMAMEAYLATIGRDKVGFSIIERKPDGTPVYIGSVRGVVERNTMRYYLAIESYLGAYHLAPAEQTERRLRDWHAGVERFARQLHELDLNEYLDMKRREIARQQSGSKSNKPG